MIILFLFFGICGGLLGGMGLGGGTVLIPLLSVVCGVEQHVAQAINLICFIPMSIIALIIHFKHNLVETRGLPIIILPAVLTSVLGCFISRCMDEFVLKKIFGAFLIVLAVISIIVHILKSKSSD